MADIREFLLERIAEDETAAKTAKAEFAHAGYGCYGPDRVLSECETTRAIVGEHGPGENWYRDYCETCADWEDAQIGEGPPNIAFPCPTLRAVAAVYRDHPDYQQEWNDTNITESARGGVIEGSLPIQIMVRHIEGNDYREYWDGELNQWVRILSAQEIHAYGEQALDALNRGLPRG